MRAPTLVLAVASLAACTEKLENDVGCPALCPTQSTAIQTQVIEPVALDSTVAALVAQGSEPRILLAARGDTLDSRAVVRFDTVQNNYRRSAGETLRTITSVDSANLRLRLDLADAKRTQPVTIDVFDVDTTANDTAVAALFRADRLIGSKTFATAELRDTVFVPISDARVLAASQTGARLRVGVRISSAASAQFRVFTTESGLAPRVIFRANADTAAGARIEVSPLSKTPDQPLQLKANLADYAILLTAPARGPATALNVGGLPARRTYLRFDIPSAILNSSIVRATLILTQLPNRTIDPQDSIKVTANLVVAGAAITDVTRAAALTVDPLFVSLDSLRLAHADSGERSIDIATLVRYWKTQKAEETPHALVLISTRENESPLEARFFSIEAAAALRPRLRISYTPQGPVGLP